MSFVFVPVIAPYWMKLDGCTISYVSATSDSSNSQIGAIFRQIRVITEKSDIDFMFLIEWRNCIPAGSNDNLTSITFQLALATNGAESFAISNYPYGQSNVDGKSNTVSLEVGFYDGMSRVVFIARRSDSDVRGTVQQVYNLDKIRGNTGRNLFRFLS